MRYLLVSDLHSNDEALSAVLARVRRKKLDRVVCLGDFVGYAADPNKTLDRIRTLPRPAISIRGNHDKVVAGVDSGEMFNPPALYAARWTAERLSKENLEFLKRLPCGPILVDESFAICHGSPLDEDAYIFSDWDAQMNFVHMDRVAPAVSVSFFGHSHIPSIFTLERDGILVEAVSGQPPEALPRAGEEVPRQPGLRGPAEGPEPARELRDLRLGRTDGDVRPRPVRREERPPEDPEGGAAHDPRRSSPPRALRRR